MRLNAQELSVRKRRVVEHARSNFTLSSANSASDPRPNATRDGAYSETACSDCGSSAAAGSDTVLLDADREDRTLVSAVEAVTEILAVRRVDRIEKDFEHRVACGQSKGHTHRCE
jgi:hypothetical protein